MAKKLKQIQVEINKAYEDTIDIESVCYNKLNKRLSVLKQISSLFSTYWKIEGNNQWIPTENSGTYYTIKVETTLYVYFQGSSGKVDWYNNFDFPIRPYTPDKASNDISWYCHKGFLKVWKSILGQIKEQLLDTEIKEIVIFGYSHGAAIATLCHEWCSYNRKDIKLTGFALEPPRVYWGSKKNLNKIKNRWNNFYFIRNCNDIVTHVPPKLFGYKHVVEPFLIGEKGEFNCFEAHDGRCIVRALNRRIEETETKIKILESFKRIKENLKH